MSKSIKMRKMREEKGKKTLKKRKDNQSFLWLNKADFWDTTATNWRLRPSACLGHQNWNSTNDFSFWYTWIFLGGWGVFHSQEKSMKLEYLIYFEKLNIVGLTVIEILSYRQTYSQTSCYFSIEVVEITQIKLRTNQTKEKPCF